jgi:hypothetical protein
MTPRLLVVVSLSLSSIACAGGRRDVLAPDAPLGRVVVYRNGVAYFERVAKAQKDLTLSVPQDRIDDFLKSLRVADAKTGEPLPVSYRTSRVLDDKYFHLHVAMPRGRRSVRLTYVTESPSWKPSYRVVLGEEGSRLQALAIVDNVSGESWRGVELGLGTTSALSFRYDLHSVQSVERERIEEATKLGAAPPTGGSPYAGNGAGARVVAVLDASEYVDLPTTQDHAGSGGESKYTAEGATLNNPRFGRANAAVVEEFVEVEHRGPHPITGSESLFHRVEPEQAKAAPYRPPADPIDELFEALAKTSQRVRVEALALETDVDRNADPLRRANSIRETLVTRGIARDRIEAIGVPEVAEDTASAVRVVAVDDPPPPLQSTADTRDGGPAGTAHFVLARPMTIDAGDSVMVTLFDDATKADRVYLYDPISQRGSKRFAFTAVRIVNPSDNQLDAGPITVYADKRFLGEGMTEPIPPRGLAIVPYALDRNIVVERHESSADEVESLRTVERGIATAQTKRTRRHELAFVNRGKEKVRVLVRHHVPEGWSLRAPPDGLERLGGDVLVPVDVAAGGTTELVLEEALPMSTAIDLRSGRDLRALELHVAKLPEDGPLRRDLAAILAAHRKLRDLSATLASRRDHAGELRNRVAELTGQLAALGKLGRAQGLSGDLAKRARQLGTQYERAAAEIAELERERLARSVELDNLVADLRLPP